MIRAENKLIMMVIRAKQSPEKISSAQVANFPIWPVLTHASVHSRTKLCSV